MENISKADAVARGLKRYYTGQPCKRGHVAEHRVGAGCVQCSVDSAVAFNRAHPELAKARVSASKAKHREKYNAAQRARYASDPVAARAAHAARVLRGGEKYRATRRKRAGLPEPTHPASVCECCGAAPKRKRLALDHDHHTGAFRGWLCDACNLGIGKLGDSREGLLRALAYVDKRARILLRAVA